MRSFVNEIKDYIRHNKFVVCIIALLLGLLFVISFNLPLTGDDFSYSMNRATGLHLNSVGDVVESVFYEYQHWMGRIACFFFAQLAYFSPKQILFRLTYPFVQILILVEIFYLITKQKLQDKNCLLFIVEIFLYFVVTRKIANQTYFWIIGYYTYILPLVFILPALTSCVDVLLNRKINIDKITFILTFIGCLFIEHYTLVVLGFLFVAILIIYLKTKKIDKRFLLLFIISFVALLILLLCPGIRNRPLNSSFTSRRELLYFGYTRFIYTFYALNQNIFLFLSIILIITFYKKKGLYNYILIVLLIPIVLIAIILLFDLPLLSEDTKYFLTFAWSYYHYDRVQLLKTSLIAIYTIVVFLFAFIRLSFEYKNSFILVTAFASILSQLIFIITELACERTSYISYFLIMLILLYVIYQEKMWSKYLTLLLPITIFVLFNYAYFYVNEYSIFLQNETRYKECAVSNCKLVYVDENNYDYVFKSELDFSNQENWVLRDIRKYYGLDKNCIIKAFENDE